MMRTFLWFGALLSAGAAAAADVGNSNLVIDVEYWGRQRLVLPDPNGGGDDIVTYGDPLQGAFRIFTEAAPEAARPSTFPTDPNAARYGRGPYSPGNPAQPASFVTSDLGPLAGNPDDYVNIGDGLLFRPGETRRDWFEVADVFSISSQDRSPATLFVSVTTPLDIIQGTGLDQEFDLVNPVENGGTGGGFLQTTVDGVGKFLTFIVDRLHVTRQLVCRP